MMPLKIGREQNKQKKEPYSPDPLTAEVLSFDQEALAAELIKALDLPTASWRAQALVLVVEHKTCQACKRTHVTSHGPMVEWKNSVGTTKLAPKISLPPDMRAEELPRRINKIESSCEACYFQIERVTILEDKTERTEQVLVSCFAPDYDGDASGIQLRLPGFEYEARKYNKVSFSHLLWLEREAKTALEAQNLATRVRARAEERKAAKAAAKAAKPAPAPVKAFDLSDF